MKRDYYIDSHLIASGPVPPHISFSLLWFCQQCGKVYARAHIRGRPWHSRTGCCEHCTPANGVWWQIPGSIWSTFDNDYNWQLPKEVLERELLLAIKAFEEGIV